MNSVTLAVLAGGEGSRMGRPKGDLIVDGRPILEFLLRRWDFPGAKVLVTAPGREHPPGWELFDCEITDPVSGEGPLRGILTALENVGDAAVVVLATCDMPLVTGKMFTVMVEHLQRDASLVGVMLESTGGVEPFPLALRPEVVGEVRERLHRGEGSVRQLSRLPRFAVISGGSDQSVWTNLNHPEDYQRFIATAGRG